MGWGEEIPVQATAYDVATITFEREIFSLVLENVKCKKYTVTTLQIISVELL